MIFKTAQISGITVMQKKTGRKEEDIDYGSKGTGK